MINYSYQVPIRDSNGVKLSGALVELKKGATTVTLVELGTSGVYRTNAIVQGQWRVWVNSVDTGDDVEVGGGRLEDAGYAVDSIFICDTSTTIALITPTDYKAKLGLDNVSNIAIPTTLTASYYLAVNSAGTAYELVPTPTIPTATLANVASDSITQADNTYELKAGINFLIQDSSANTLVKIDESARSFLLSDTTTTNYQKAIVKGSTNSFEILQDLSSYPIYGQILMKPSDGGIAKIFLTNSSTSGNEEAELQASISPNLRLQYDSSHKSILQGSNGLSNLELTQGIYVSTLEATSSTALLRLTDGTNVLTLQNNALSTIPKGLLVGTSFVASGLTYPTADGTAGQVITTDGSGNLSFVTPASGTIGGSGTTNYLPKFTNSTTLGDSGLEDNGTSIIAHKNIKTNGFIESDSGQFIYINRLAGATNGFFINDWTSGSSVQLFEILSGGASTFFGSLTVTENVTLGDSSIDTVDVSGYLNVVSSIKSNGNIIIDDLGTPSTTGLYFKDDGVNRWITAFIDTRDYAIYRYNSSGDFQDRPIVIDNTTGDVDFANNITATEINGVALTTGGSATQYLDGTGNYSTPAGGGARTATVTWSNSGTFTSSDKYMNCMQGNNSSGSSEYPSGNSSGLSNQNGAFPFVVPFNCTVKECYIAVKGVAQSTSTPASTVTINFELQTLDADFDGFTKVSDLDFPIDSSTYTIGTYGTSSIDTNYKGVNNLGQNLNAGDVIALLFDSQNGASVCNNFQGGFITMVLEER